MEMKTVIRRHSPQVAFVVLVIVLPTMFGLGWLDHQRNVDNSRQLRLQRAAQIASCERGNTIRAEHNKLVARLGEITHEFLVLLHLELTDHRLPLDSTERAVVKKIERKIEENSQRPVLPLVDCTRIVLSEGG